MQDWIQYSGLYRRYVYITKSRLEGTLLACEEVGCRVVADEEIVSVAAIAAADQPEYGHEANSEDEGDGKDSPSHASPTEPISL